MLNEQDQELFAKLSNPDQQSQVHYAWDDDFQRIVLGLLLCDRFFMCQSVGLIKKNYFTNEIHQWIAKILFKYFDDHKQQPSKIFLKQELIDDLKSRYKHNEETYESMKLLYVAELNLVYDYYTSGGVGDMLPGLDSPEAILSKILAFAKTQAMRQAFAQSLALIRKSPHLDDTWVEVNEILNEARLVDRQSDIGLNYYETIDERYNRMQEEKESGIEVFHTGFEPVNRGLDDGGLRRGEIGAYMALPGVGKTHLVGTKVLMANGTVKNVENIIVGDLVMGNDSTPRKVLSLHNFFDESYEIRPVKGESYFVNALHMLSLKNSHRQGGIRHNRPCGRDKNPAFEHHPARMGNTNIYNISVEDWLKQSNHFKVKMKGWRTGVEFNERKVKISPYILGTWLGDGTSNMAQLTNFDAEVVVEWAAEGNSRGLNVIEKVVGHYTMCDANNKHICAENSFYQDLKHYNLIKNKHIPHDYKINSRENRLQLLAGLMDTDGSKSQNCFDFVNKNKQLAEDVVFVARSLGLAAYMKECRKKCQTGAEGTYYRITISGNTDEIPVRIPRKKCIKRGQVKDHLLTGIKVIPTGKTEEFFGFETDGNHLFLLADFTVVHNSLALVQASVLNVSSGKKVLYITTEMDQDRVAKRFDCMTTSIGHNKLQEQRENVKRALLEGVRDYEDKRRLVVKQFPSGTADVNTFRAYYAQLGMWGFKPDLMIVDYIGDMKDFPGIPTWESRFRILRDLRGFGVESNHCTLTALQPNKSAAELKIEDFIDESKLADSFMQNRVLDAFWTINQTANEQKAEVGRIYVAKTRNGRSKFSFKIQYDFKDQTLRMTDISDDTYRGRMAKVSSKDSDATAEQMAERATRSYSPSEGERQ